MRQRSSNGWRGLLPLACVLAALLATGANAGCQPTAPTSEQNQRTAALGAEETSPAIGSPYLMGYVDFRESATKVASLSEAEEAIGAKVRAPAETRGRKLQQIYVVGPYSKEQPWDTSAILDYGDFTVGFDFCGSPASAATMADQRCDPDAEAAGLARRVQVRGVSATVLRKGESEMVVDADGKTVQPGISQRGSVVSWSIGSVLLSVSSTSVSDDELLLIAESIDYK